MIGKIKDGGLNMPNFRIIKEIFESMVGETAFKHFYAVGADYSFKPFTARGRSLSFQMQLFSENLT